MTKTRKTKPADRTENGTGTAVVDLDGKPTEGASPAVANSEPNADPKPVGPTELNPAPPLATKPLSKQQQLAALVARDEGATLDQMIAATGWLPHTTRAALTGLRKKRYVITSDKVDGVPNLPGGASRMNRIDLDAELTALESMPLAELRLAWTRWVKTTPPKVSAALLRLALAHQLQSKVMGGVTRAMERRLAEIAGGTAAVRTNPGTRFVREWRGKVHVVTMTENGRYRWQERDWNSLSEIARTITGTQWSGPAFFGTKSRKKAAA